MRATAFGNTHIIIWLVLFIKSSEKNAEAKILFNDQPQQQQTTSPDPFPKAQGIRRSQNLFHQCELLRLRKSFRFELIKINACLQAAGIPISFMPAGGKFLFQIFDKA